MVLVLNGLLANIPLHVLVITTVLPLDEVVVLTQISHLLDLNLM